MKSAGTRPLALALLLVAHQTACDSPPDDVALPESSAPSARPSETVLPTAGMTTGRQPSASACVAAVVEGGVSIAGTNASVNKDAVLDAKTWITVAPGARITTRVASANRRFTLEGPALAVPCFREGTTPLVHHGRLRTESTGAGNALQERLFATTLGLLRDKGAAFEAQVEAGRVEIVVRAGTASFVPRTEKFPEAVQHGRAFRHEAEPPPPEELRRACTSAATAAQQSGRLAAAPPATGTSKSDDKLAPLIRDHLRAQRQAEKACGVAAAAAGGLHGNPEFDSYWADIVGAEEQWRGLASLDTR